MFKTQKNLISYYTCHVTNLGMFSVRKTNEVSHECDPSGKQGNHAKHSLHVSMAL